MQRKIELKRGVDNTSVEAYLVDLVQRHVDDYVNYWVESLRLFSQSVKSSQNEPFKASFCRGILTF